MQEIKNKIHFHKSINLKIEAKQILLQLIDSISNISLDEYTQKIQLLSNSSIGEHTRHIIELFQQLIDGYETENINYDNRKRNSIIQENIDYAISCLANIIFALEKENKILKLHTTFQNSETIITTNYYRELMYNIEHCIHHQAIIKIAFISLGITHLEENFGVASSTIKYRKQCAQ